MRRLLPGLLLLALMGADVAEKPTLLFEGNSEAMATATQPTASPTARPIATPTSTIAATATETPEWALSLVPVPWPVDCDNEYAWDGYRLEWASGYCVPGLLSEETINSRLIRDYYGALSSYAEGVMERLEDRHGVRRGYGVALMSCALMGQIVYLRVPGFHDEWQGPFTAVDCSGPAGTYYHIAVAGLAAEIGYTRAEAWGLLAARRVDVHMGGRRPDLDWHGVNLAGWWAANVLAWDLGRESWMWQARQ